MSKPDDISDKDWHRASMAVVHAPEYTLHLHEDVARAIATARAEGMAAAAEIAEAATKAPGQRNAKDQWREQIGAEVAAAIRKGEP